MHDKSQICPCLLIRIHQLFLDLGRDLFLADGTNHGSVNSEEIPGY